MSLRDTLFSFRGRIDRRTYWLGALTVVALQIAALVALLPILKNASESTLVTVLVGYFLAMTVLTGPTVLALLVKRLRDVGRQPWVICAVGLLAFSAAILARALGTLATPSYFEFLMVVPLAVVAWVPLSAVFLLNCFEAIADGAVHASALAITAAAVVGLASTSWLSFELGFRPSAPSEGRPARLDHPNTATVAASVSATH